jgi:hypothetical protein
MKPADKAIETLKIKATLNLLIREYGKEKVDKVYNIL